MEDAAEARGEIGCGFQELAIFRAGEPEEQTLRPAAQSIALNLQRQTQLAQVERRRDKEDHCVGLVGAGVDQRQQIDAGVVECDFHQRLRRQPAAQFFAGAAPHRAILEGGKGPGAIGCLQQQQ